MSWEDYLANRAFRGEKPHLVAARIKGIDISTLIPDETKEVEEVTTDSESLRESPGIEGFSEKAASAIADMPIILPRQLWDRLAAIAERERRTPGQQCLYILERFVAAKDMPISEPFIRIIEMAQHVQQALRIPEIAKAVKEQMGV